MDCVWPLEIAILILSGLPSLTANTIVVLTLTAILYQVSKFLAAMTLHALLAIFDKVSNMSTIVTVDLPVLNCCRIWLEGCCDGWQTTHHIFHLTFDKSIDIRHTGGCLLGHDCLHFCFLVEAFPQLVHLLMHSFHFCFHCMGLFVGNISWSSGCLKLCLIVSVSDAFLVQSCRYSIFQALRFFIPNVACCCSSGRARTNVSKIMLSRVKAHSVG